MRFDVRPFARHEPWDAFDSDHSPGKHLLTIYSAAIGVRARRVGEIGIGSTARAPRAAMQDTGGRLHSCDGDVKRFSDLLAEQDQHWSLELCRSEEYLRRLDPPLDLFMHDGAHDYHQFKLDLKAQFFDHLAVRATLITFTRIHVPGCA